MPKVPRKPNRARKPQLPEGIAASRARVPKVKGRKEFTIVDYDPNQKQRYRSQYARYQKALNLRPDAIDDTIPTNLKYRFFSDRAPTGYWQVENLGYGGWGCDCPDFFKQQKANPNSYQSEQIDREWVSSAAGAPEECKHIIALKLYLGLPYTVPRDPPIP